MPAFFIPKLAPLVVALLSVVVSPSVLYGSIMYYTRDQGSANLRAFPGFNYAVAAFGVGFTPSISAESVGKYFAFHLLGSSSSRF